MPDSTSDYKFDYNSIEDLLRCVEARGAAGKANTIMKISAFALAEQAETLEAPPEKLFSAMEAHYQVMKEAAAAGLKEDLRSTSGLTGGDAFRMAKHKSEKTLSGDFCCTAITKALAIAEYNAAMGKIVAAPTAGSCGILPAALLTMEELYAVPQKDIVMALFCAGAFGMIVAKNASIAGAEGGCQAECGSAAAIAAAALVELAGGSPDASAQAFAIALKNQLGLVCDPVAGLVEIPCIKRNAGSVMNAICAAEMALAGIRSKIPPDEVLAAMRDVGEALPKELRETACGGLAVTKTGIALKQRIFGHAAVNIEQERDER